MINAKLADHFTQIETGVLGDVLLDAGFTFDSEATGEVGDDRDRQEVTWFKLHHVVIGGWLCDPDTFRQIVGDDEYNRLERACEDELQASFDMGCAA